MSTKRDEVKELLRQIVKKRLVERVGVQNIVYSGEEVNVIKGQDGSIRFNLPRLGKSYAYLSGRLYERQYTGVNPSPSESHDPSSLIVEQLDYMGNAEKVDTRLFGNRLVCTCGNVRWVKKADLFQVKKCKPCI
ncbi:MAG: hypothetical protein ABSB79_11410, partial [Syntrophales bacterium]